MHTELSCSTQEHIGAKHPQQEGQHAVLFTALYILLCFRLRKAATCPAKSLAGISSVIDPDHNYISVPALVRTQIGVKAKVRVEGPIPEQGEGRRASGPPRAVLEKIKKSKLCTENAHVQQRHASLPVLVMFKAITPLTLPLKKQQQSLINGKGGEKSFTFSWFLGLLQHCLINREQDLCAIKCSGEVADAKALHLGFESLSKMMRISVYSHLGKESPPENRK